MQSILAIGNMPWGLFYEKTILAALWTYPVRDFEIGGDAVEVRRNDTVAKFLNWCSRPGTSTASDERPTTSLPFRNNLFAAR